MKIVCIGDSITYGYGVRQREAWPYLLSMKYNVHIVNRGINGDTTEGMCLRFDRHVIKEKPSHVIILGGVNDIMMGIDLDEIQENISNMVHMANENNIVPIVGIPIKTDPQLAPIQWSSTTDFYEVNEKLILYRKWILGFAKKFNVEVIDFYEGFNKYMGEDDRSDYYSDGLHLTSKGNEIMAKLINLRY
ncbi:GDSL-type esterase/lipase family protein [Anaeromicrobium sediminis]|uniref:SGNH hydrolase-type esterase domain-containing protein n=1 Tax=Anaeromicrobium sediminis TaxID=1478221 RepID=A0A267MBD5_9FIRM|nr:GDSL-type esterase/lipase family protein [Anaeromicrobium sediminis]PAB56891.1 hypothetical protein CCE28_19960 [Anaeromicrobium sediminis]